MAADQNKNRGTSRVLKVNNYLRSISTAINNVQGWAIRMTYLVILNLL